MLLITEIRIKNLLSYSSLRNIWQGKCLLILSSCVGAARKVSPDWLQKNNDMSFFQLFKYCLGLGLGTIGDFLFRADTVKLNLTFTVNVVLHLTIESNSYFILLSQCV